MASIASCSLSLSLSLSADDVVLLFDEQFRLLEFNERALQFCGYSREELGARVPSLHGRMTSMPPVRNPNGTPSRGEGS